MLASVHRCTIPVTQVPSVMVAIVRVSVITIPTTTVCIISMYAYANIISHDSITANTTITAIRKVLSI